MESDPKHAAKTTQEFLRKGKFSRYCLIVHIYTNLPVYATIHTTGDKLSEFPNVISQFYKLVVLIFVPHPPSFFKIPALLISTEGSASETFPNLQFNSRLSHSPLSTEKRSQT